MPRPPITANTGTSTPRKRTLKGARYQASSRSTSTSPGSLRIRLRANRQRSPISAMCAIVNDSIAPNAYSVARNSACPGIITTHAIAPNTPIAVAGVRNRGLIRRRRSGSCWYCPIE